MQRHCVRRCDRVDMQVTPLYGSSFASFTVQASSLSPCAWSIASTWPCTMLLERILSGCEIELRRRSDIASDNPKRSDGTLLTRVAAPVCQGSAAGIDFLLPRVGGAVTESSPPTSTVSPALAPIKPDLMPAAVSSGPLPVLVLMVVGFSYYRLLFYSNAKMEAHRDVELLYCVFVVIKTHTAHRRRGCSWFPIRTTFLYA